MTLSAGERQVVGTVASDTLSVGSPPITVQDQGFGLVFHASTDFLGVSCDGLFVRPATASERETSL